MQPDDSQNAGKWSYHKENDRSEPSLEQTPLKNHEPVSWTASEFIAHHKDPGWYLVLFAGTAILCAIIYFTTGDLISITCIVLVSIMFAALASRKPQQRHFEVNGQGIGAGDKFYPYSMFKSFAVLHEGAIGYINLMPLKRFMPDISIYYPLEDEGKIVAVLGDNLPYAEREEHGFDKLMKRLRF